MSSPLKLLWLLDSLTLGGAESLALAFARGVAERDVELTVACLKSIDGNPLETELRRNRVDVVNLGSRNLRDVAAFRRLTGVIREGNYHVVHAHLTYASIWGVAAARGAGVPAVATLHLPPSSAPRLSRDAVREWLMQRFLRRADRVVAVSDAVRRDYLRHGTVPAEKLVVVHNGIDTDHYLRDELARVAVRRELGIDPGARVAATISVLREGKGLDRLLASVRSVVEEVPSAHFVIAGDGPLAAELRGIVAALDISRHVTFAGYRRDVNRILSAADLCVLPTLRDAFPTVLLEAMAASLPVVASDVGGVPEIVVDGVTGRLTDPDDGAGLARSIASLLGDREAAAKMGEAGRARAVREFSTSVWIGNLTALYRDVISRRVAA
jgi:glycosyltransferase involved in cell wall biosynthesis